MTFELYSAVHQLLLESDTPVVEVQGIVVSKEKNCVEVFFDTNEDTKVKELSSKLVCEALHNNRLAFHSVLTIQKSKPRRDIVASKRFLDSLDIPTETNYHRTITCDNFELSRKTYHRILKTLTAYRWKSRIEKIILLKDFTLQEKVDDIVLQIDAFEGQYDTKKISFLKKKIRESFLDVNFQTYLDALLHFFNFRMSSVDSRIIEKLFLRVLKVWLHLEYSLPDELIPYVTDIIDCQKLEYGTSTLNSEWSDIRATLQFNKFI